MSQIDIHNRKAKAIMSKNPISVHCDEELSAVLGKMRDNDIHDLPVVENRKLVGLVSYDTFLKRRNIPLTAKVEHFMSFPPRLSPTDSVMKIAELMLSSGFRAVPVTKEDKLVGIVTRSDLVSIIPSMKILNDIQVKEIMTQSPKCLSEKDTLDKAKSLMSRLDVRALPVVDDDNCITGVIGLKNLSEYAWRKKVSVGSGQRGGGESSPMKIVIESVMNKPPVSIDEESDISEVVKLMLENSISTIIVTEKNVPIGIVTQYDLMELIASFQKKDSVYVQISGLEMGDSDIYDIMYEIIQKSMKRLGKVIKPKVFTIHVSMHSEGSDHHSGKYQLSGRLTSDHSMYYAKAMDWDILRCLSEMLGQIERMIRKDKKKTLDKRKHGG